MSSKYTGEKIDQYLACLGINLLPSQRQLFEKAVNTDKIYITFPPHAGRTHAKHMMECLELILERGEENGTKSSNI